jgi:2-C-methyl-D-erythritol 4-phosphate cytidylyltransferase
MNELAAIIVAAGRSQRMGGVDKQMRTIAGVPVLVRTVAAFEACDDVGAIILVLNPDNMAAASAISQEYAWTKVRATVAGGERRQDSVGAGLAAMARLERPDGTRFEWVAVHDGARPLVTPALVSRGLEAAREVGAAVAATPATETVKMVDASGTITSTPERSNLWIAQTPQIFRADVLTSAYRALEERGDDAEATDCARLVEMLGRPVKVFEGERTNIKITTALDLLIAEAIVKSRESGVGRR